MSGHDRQRLGGPEGEDHQAVSASRYALFVIPSGRGGGFHASIRGHVLELADPDSGHGFAPTPDDLLTAAIASDIAWFAQRFLRDHGLDDYVSVSTWAQGNESVAGARTLDVTVEVSRGAAAAGVTLVAALERRVAARSSLPAQLRVRQV